MSGAELTLKEFAGQGCDVSIYKRGGHTILPGSIYVTFRSEPGFGHPTLELDQLEKLIEKCKLLREED